MNIMNYDNGGYPPDYDDRTEQIINLENIIKELRTEIASLNKEISNRDALIKSLKSDYILKKELEIRNLEEANERLKDDFKKLMKQLKEQSTIEAGEKAILDRVYEFMEIVDNMQHNTPITQLYELNFIPTHYRMIIDKTVKDYLVSKGVVLKKEGDRK